MNTSGDMNTFLGMQTGYANTVGEYNTFLGAQAGNTNTTGVHNTYLMILGEAGLPALIAFLAFWARTLWKVANSNFGVFAIGASAVLLCSMITAHGVLALKVPDVMLAFVMAIAARAPMSRMTFFTSETVPRGPQP